MWHITSQMALVGKEPTCQCRKHKRRGFEPWVRSLGQDDPLEEEMATHSSILAWRIPRTEERGRLQPKGSQSRTKLKWHSTAQHNMIRRNGQEHSLNQVVTVTGEKASILYQPSASIKDLTWTPRCWHLQRNPTPQCRHSINVCRSEFIQKYKVGFLTPRILHRNENHHRILVNK